MLKLAFYRVAVAISLVSLLQACGETLSAEDYLKRAADLRANNDLAGAIVEIKNAVQVAPENAEARYELGAAHAENREYAGALKEFQRARKLGMATDALNQALASAMISSAQFDQAAAELAIYGDFEQAAWQELQATLDLSVGRYDEAQRTFKDILRSQPNNHEARQGLIRALIGINQLDEARAELKTALANEPGVALLWVMQGELEVQAAAFDKGKVAYAKALELEPAHYGARVGLIGILASRGEFDEAATALAHFTTESDSDPRIVFLRGLIAEGQGNADVAIGYYRLVIQAIPSHVPTLQRLANLHFRAGEHSQAIEYLQRLTEIDPSNEEFRRQLGAANLAAGRLDGGLLELDALNIDIDQQTDANLLALLGSAYARQGQFKDGVRSLERAMEMEPGSIPIRIQLALSYLRGGTAAPALELLNGVLQEHPENESALVLAILAQAANKNLAEANAIAKRLINASPQKPIGYNVRGYLHLAAKDYDKARADFDRALEIDPAFLSAHFNLARLERALKNDDAVKLRLESILKIAPHNPEALVSLGKLAEQAGDTLRAVELWESARQQNLDAPAPRALLARYYRQNNQMQFAIDVIKEAYTVAPYLPVVQHEYALINLLNGSTTEAMPAIEKLETRFPLSITVQQLKVMAYRLLGDEKGYQAALERIVQLQSDNYPARASLAALAIKNDDFLAAHKLAEELLKIEGREARAYELRGAIFAAESKFKQAISDLERALNIDPTARLVLKLDAVERRAGISSSRLEQWLKANPEDKLVQFQLAANKHSGGDEEQAMRSFEDLLAKDPENPILLNNLAWIYHERDDPRALDYAKKANKSRPESPEIMDTYGWILLASGKVEQALSILQEAMKKAPNNSDIRFHYASALAEVGQRRLALSELEKILGEGKAPFSSAIEAEKLLLTLRDER